jgi:hypothetical protein
VWRTRVAKYPKLFSAGHGLFNGLFEEFPYLLPNVMAVLVCGTGLVLSYFYLTENKIPQRAVEVEREIYGPLDDEESSEGAALELDDDADFVSSVEMKVVHSPDWRMKSEIASKETEDWQHQRRRGGDDEEEQDQRELHHPQAADDQGRTAAANHAAAAEKSLRLTGEQESTLTEKVDGEGEGPLSSLRSVLRLHAPWSSSSSSTLSVGVPTCPLRPSIVAWPLLIRFDQPPPPDYRQGKEGEIGSVGGPGDSLDEPLRPHRHALHLHRRRTTAPCVPCVCVCVCVCVWLWQRSVVSSTLTTSLISFPLGVPAVDDDRAQGRRPGLHH